MFSICERQLPNLLFEGGSHRLFEIHWVSCGRTVYPQVALEQLDDMTTDMGSW